MLTYSRARQWGWPRGGGADVADMVLRGSFFSNPTHPTRVHVWNVVMLSTKSKFVANMRILYDATRAVQPTTLAKRSDAFLDPVQARNRCYGAIGPSSIKLPPKQTKMLPHFQTNSTCTILRLTLKNSEEAPVSCETSVCHVQCYCGPSYMYVRTYKKSWDRRVS